MNIIKSAIIGSAAAMTAVMIYKEVDKKTVNKMIKKGKHVVEKMGLI